MTIYLDIFFFENLIINYLILYITLKTLKLKVKRQSYKLIISSIIGSIYSLLCIIFQLKQYFVIKIGISAIMIYIVFFPKRLSDFLKYIMFFYLVTFTLGGTMVALTYTINSKTKIINEKGFITKKAFEIITISILIVIYIIKNTVDLNRKEINNTNIICKIIIYINNRSIKTTGLIDSGNLLLDPVTKKPVIVLETKQLIKIMPKEDLQEIMNILKGNIEIDRIKNIYKERIRILPFKSIGKENGFMVGIKSDKVKILTECKEIIKKNIVIALYDKKIAKDDKYTALLGINILKEN